MKLQTIIIYALVCFTYSLTAQQPPDSEVKKDIRKLGNMMNKSDIGSQTFNYFIDVAKYTMSDNAEGIDKKYQDALKDANSDIERFDADFNKVIAQTNQKFQTDKIIFKSSMYLGRLTTSPIASIPIIGTIYKETSDAIVNAAEADMNTTYAKRLSLKLDELKTKNEAKYNKIIETGDYESVKKALDDVNYFANKMPANVDPAFKQVVEKTQEQFLRNAVKNTLKRTIDDIGEVKESLSAVENNLNGLAQFTYGFAEEANKRMNTLGQNQKKLEGKLNSFYNEYQKDKKAMNFMQEFMYNKMNTAEQIRALDAGLFPDMDDKERARIREQKELLQEREELINSTKSYLNTASAALQVLDNLGIDSKLVKDVATAVNYGQSAVAAFEMIGNGNYIGAALKITGLFKKKGPDIGAQRHKQVMAYLKRIDAKLDKMDAKLDSLLSGQRKIIDLQIKSINLIIDLSQKVDEYYNQTNLRLNNIENAIYHNRQLIVNNWRSDCKSCYDVINSLDSINIDAQRLPSEEIVKKAYTNLKMGGFKNCEDYINFYLMDKFGINPYFHYETYVKDVAKGAYVRMLDTINDLSFKLLFQAIDTMSSQTDKDKYSMSLFFPVDNIETIRTKYEAQSIRFSNEFYKLPREYFKSFLMADIIADYGYIIRNVGFLYNLTDENRDLITFERFVSDNAPRHRDVDLKIKEAIQLHNVAIAQQNILSGDILLKILFDISVNQIQNNDAQFPDAKRLLELNSLLGKNFTEYYIKHYLEYDTLSQAQYFYAYSSKEEYLMNDILKSPFKIAFIKSDDARIGKYNLEEGWYFIIGKSHYLMPAPEIINAPTPIQKSALTDKLVQNRNYLLENLRSKLPEQSDITKNWNYLIMKNR